VTEDKTVLGSTVARRLCRLLVIGLALYVLVCIGCALFQRRLIYFPPRFTPEQADEAAHAAGLVRWTNSSGQAIGMKLPSPQSSTGQVLIVYGNGSWTVGCASYGEVIQSLAAFDVFILEYPGCADRPGSPSQENIFRAADEAFKLLDKDKPIYLVGESLGSGVAAYLAGKCPDHITGLMLLSPYNRLTDVAQARMPLLPVKLMLIDRFPSTDYLKDYHGPVGIMVDGRDEVVPEKFGIQLFDSYAGPKRFWRFPDSGHIAIEAPPKLWSEVLDFLAHQQARAIPLLRHSSCARAPLFAL
jgi:pimeloyl-ACP methyl ester carboxylesterase